MTEEKYEVKTYQVIARCECGGKMHPTGIIYSTYPAQYPHICDKCNKAETFNERYPKIVYEYVTGGEDNGKDT